jgi:hypothetical protein
MTEKSIDNKGQQKITTGQHKITGDTIQTEQDPKSWEQLYNELRYDTGQIKHISKELRDTSTVYNTSISKNIKSLAGVVDSLDKASFMLHRLPEKVKEYLKAMIPEISREIKTVMLEDLDKSTKVCYENLNKLDQKISIVTGKVNDVEYERVKKLFITMVSVVIISIVTAAGATYFMLIKFPTQMTIRHDGDVHVENSNVSVWGHKNLKVFDKRNEKK